MSEQRQILRNSRVMVLMTTFSRIFGLVRVQVIAYLLGTTRLADIWTISFMIPNLFRRLIAEGAMSSAFVPILSELTEKEQKEAANAFIRSIFSLVLLVSVLIVTTMILALPQVLPYLFKYTNPLGNKGPDFDLLSVMLPTRIMFPYLLFVSLAAICQGVLNVHNRFGLPAATPILLNISVILFGLLLKDFWSEPIWGLCVGVLVGGFFQFFLQWAQLWRMGIRLLPVATLFTRRTREAIHLWVPTTFSAGIVQVNALVGTLIAINLIEGGAMALENSTRLLELILGIFTVALSTSLLPTLSRQRTRNDLAGLSESLFNSIGVLSLITIPASLGLLLAGPELIQILLQHGKFNTHSQILTYTALIFHSMALIPISWYRLVIQIFYAYKQVRITVWIACGGALTNILGCFLLPLLFDRELAHCGVAMATLVSSWCLFLSGILISSRRFQLKWPSRLNWELAKMLVAGLAFVPIWLWNPIKAEGIVFFVAKVCASMLIYGILVWLFKVSAARQIVHR